MSIEDRNKLKAAAEACHGWQWPDRKRDEHGTHHFGRRNEDGDFYEIGTVDASTYTGESADDIRVLKFLRMAQPAAILSLITDLDRAEMAADAEARDRDEWKAKYEALAQVERAQAVTAQVPEGWRLVPIEATPEMFIRGGEEFFDCARQWKRGSTRRDQDNAGAIFCAMLAAAPAAPSQQVAAPAVDRINLKHGGYITRETKTSGENGWLLRNEHGPVRGLNVFECEFVDCALAAAPAVQVQADDPWKVIDPDFVFGLADTHADATLENGNRVIDRGGILQLVVDALNRYAPALAAAPAAVQAAGQNANDAAREENQKMMPYQQRVIDEKTARDAELAALRKFIRQSTIFETLDLAEQWRLTTQCHIMVQLSAILGQRIEAFAAKPSEAA